MILWPSTSDWLWQVCVLVCYFLEIAYIYQKQKQIDDKKWIKVNKIYFTKNASIKYENIKEKKINKVKLEEISMHLWYYRPFKRKSRITLKDFRDKILQIIGVRKSRNTFSLSKGHDLLLWERIELKMTSLTYIVLQ